MSLATTVPRKQAERLAKPAARYWKGKAPAGIDAVESDSDEEGDDVEGQGDDVASDEQVGGEESEEDEGMTLRTEIAKTRAMNIALKDVSVSKDGRVKVAGKEESGRTALERGAYAAFCSKCFLLTRPAEIKAEGEEDEESSEEESEDEESGEDEVAPFRMPCLVLC